MGYQNNELREKFDDHHSRQFFICPDLYLQVRSCFLHMTRPALIQVMHPASYLCWRHCDMMDRAKPLSVNASS
jgi:hypothetical protein